MMMIEWEAPDLGHALNHLPHTLIAIAVPSINVPGPIKLRPQLRPQVKVYALRPLILPCLKETALSSMRGSAARNRN